MKTIYYLTFLLIALAFSLSLNASNFVVSVAGSNVNGTYVDTGFLNQGKPFYVLDTNNSLALIYEGNVWKIAGIEPYYGDYLATVLTTYYYTDVAGSTPPSTGWTKSSGILPVSVVKPESGQILYSSFIFTESPENDGTIDNTITITYNNQAGDTFTGINGDDFVAAGKVAVSHLPAGLTARILRTGDFTLVAVLTGTANSHNNANDISNLTFTFKNSAFVGGDVSSVANYVKRDMSVNFIQIINVGSTGDYTTIAAALAAARDGDILNLAAQTFTEPGLTIGDINNLATYLRNVTLQGQGAQATIIQGATSSALASDPVFMLDYETTVTMKNLTIRNGNSAYGGGIYSAGDQLNLVNVDINSNTAANSGGGIYISGESVVSIVNCTIHHNSGGSGVYVGSGSASIVNSTIAYNSGVSSIGGGITCDYTCSVEMTNCTVNLNQGTGISALGSGNITMANTMLVGNTSADYKVYHGVSLTDNGYNIVEKQVSSNVSGNWRFTHANDILYNLKTDGSASSQWTRNNSVLANQQVDLGTELLDNSTQNGTQTFAIGSTSFAINAATNTGAPTTDQRGKARNGSTDIGAYEYYGATVSTPTLTTTAVSTYNGISATLGGVVSSDGGATATERGVVYSLSGTPDISDTKVQIGSGTGTFSLSATGLLWGTRYYVRAYAINSAGIAYGSVQSFVTTPLPPKITSTPVTTAVYDKGYIYNILATTEGGQSTVCSAPTKPDWLTFKAAQSKATSFLTFAPASYLGGIAGDDKGNIYVLPKGSTVIYLVKDDGTTSVWKTGVISYSQMQSLHISSGYLYISRADETNTITRIPLDNPTATEEIFASFFGGGKELTEKDGWIYTTNSTQIIRINETTKEKQVFLDESDGLPQNYVNGLTFGLDGNLYIVELYGGNVLKYDGTSITEVGPALGDWPMAIRQDQEGNFYVATFSSGIRKFDSNFMNYQIVSANPTDGARDMAMTPSGALVYAVFTTNQIYRLQTSAVLSGVPAKSQLGSYPVVLRATNSGGYTEQTFTVNVVDNIKPTLTALSPADGSNGVYLNPTLSLTFDEEVSLSATGTLTLQSGGTTVLSYDLSNLADRNAFTLSNDKLTLSFTITSALPKNSLVGVQISEGFIKDLNGNDLAGITIASGIWDFTTTQGNPVITNLNGDSGSFTQGGSPLVIDNGENTTIYDPDALGYSGGNLTVAVSSASASENLSFSTSGTVSLSNGMAAGSTVRVGSTVIGTIATGKDGQAGNDLIVSLNASAIDALIGTLIQNITYSNNSKILLGTRSVSVTVTDVSALSSSSAVVSVTTFDINDAPTLTATSLNPSYLEQATAEKLFSAASASTIESGQTITGLTLTIDNLANGTSEKLSLDGSTFSLTNGTTGTSATNGIAYSVSVSGSTATVTVSGGSLTVANLQTLINAISYSNTSNIPTGTNRVATITSMTDNGGTANGGQDTGTLAIASTVTIVPKDPPTLTTASVTSFDIHSATMGGNVTATGYSPVTSRGIVYSKSDHIPTLGFPNSISATNGSGSGSFSALITGLLDGTFYYMRAFATNAEGTSYGSVETFTTSIGPLSINTTPKLTVAYGHQYNYIVSAATPAGNLGTVTAPTFPAWLTFNDVSDEKSSFGNIPAGKTITDASSDEEGNVWALISDGKIYKVANDGTTTLWGSGYVKINGLCVNNRYLYYTSYGTLFRIPVDNPSATPEVFTTFSSSTAGQVIYKDGWVYVLNYVSSTVSKMYRINEITKETQELYDWTIDGLTPTGLTSGQDGSLYINTYPSGYTSLYARIIYKYDNSTVSSYCIAYSDRFSEFSQDANGNFYAVAEHFSEQTRDMSVEGHKYSHDFSSYEVISINRYTKFILYTASGALVYSDGANGLYRIQPCVNLGGMPSKSDVGSHTVVVRASNETGYTEQSFTIDVIDTIKPLFVASSPADGATDVTLRPSMSVIFDEEVSLGTSGTLTVKSGATALKSFDLSIENDRNALSLSADQKTLSFSLPNLLPSNSEIGVEISDGFVKDASGNAFAGITIASGSWNFTTMLAQNPVLSNLDGDSGSFREGDSPLLIDNEANASITDPNSSGFAGGNLTVAIGSVSATESLSIKTSATVVMSSGMAAGSTVSISGIAIGNLATGKDGQAGHDLVVTLNANATAALIGTLIQNITYSNNSEFDLGSRTVAVTVQDAFVYTSSASNVTISTSVVNDPPTLTVTGVYPTFTEHGQPVKVYSGATASTVESGQLFTGFSFNVTNLPDGASEQVVIDGSYVVLTNGTTGTTATNSLTYTVSVSGSIAIVGISGGSLSAANLQLVLNNLSYYNSSASPSSSPNRLLKILSLKDDGGTANGGNNTASFGLTLPSSVTVVVTYLPTVSTTNVTTYNSNSATMGGNVTADGGATITERGVVYSSSDNTPTIGEMGVTKDVNGTTGTGTFSKSVTGLTRGTTYYVRAYATSAEGTAYGSMQSFTTIGLPTVSTTAVTTYNGTSATLGGNATADGGASVTECGVVYSSVDDTPTIGETDVTKNINETTGTGTFSKSVTGLARGTTYYVCAYATSAEGTAYGSMQSFTTITLPTVLTIAITTFDVSSASLGGNVTADGGATVTERGVVYTTSHNTTTIGEPNVTKSVNGTTGTGTFSNPVTGLALGTTYYVRAYATSADGTAYGSLQSFTTTGLPTVSTTVVTTFDGVSATLGGDVSSDGGATVTERGIIYSSVDDTPTIGETEVTKNADGTLGTGTFSKSVTGLTRGTTYNVRAYAINAEGTVYGNLQSFTTNTFPTVSTTVVTTYDGVSATFGGAVSSEGGATVTERGIVYSSVDNTPTIGETYVTKNADETLGTGTFSKSVTGLTRETTYYVRAYAINAEGTAYGNMQSFTTSNLPTVTTAAITTFDGVSAILGGNVTVDGGTTVTERGIVYSAVDNTPTIGETDVTKNINETTGTGTFSKSVTGLARGTTYYVRAYAINAEGTAYGNMQSFTTSNLPIVTTAAITTFDSSSASLGGNVIADGGATVTERGVVYSAVDNTPAIGENDVTKNVNGTTGTGAFSKSITGFSPSTTYYVRAYAVNAEGTSYGSLQSFTTLNLPTVTTTAVSTFDGVSATLGGAVSSEGGATVTERGVVYSSVDNTPTIGETDVTKNVNGTTGTGTFSKSVAGLANNTTYFVRAYATNSEGTAYGDLQTFTTLNVLTLHNNALDFDGVNDNVSMGDVLDMGTNSFSIELWFKTSISGNSQYKIINKGLSTIDGTNCGYDFLINSDNQLYFRINSAFNGSTLKQVGSGRSLSDGIWHHAAAVVYRSAQMMYLFIDGVMTSSTNIAIVGNLDNLLPFTLGALNRGTFDATNLFFNGNLDELRIWNTARTASEIRENMMRTMVGNESGLEAYYRFDQTGGTTLYEGTANGYNGTLINMDSSADWVDSEAFTTWLGGTNGTWTEDSNWSDGVPTATDNVGIYKWASGSEAALSGSPSLTNLLFSSTASTSLGSGFTVNGNLLLEKNLDLNGQTITLGSNATLSEGAYRLYGSSGSITTTRNLSNLSAQNIGGLGAVITSAANMGSTVITRTHGSQTNVLGGKSVLRNYRISPQTNSGLNATLVYNYHTDELNGISETQLALHKSIDGGTTFTYQGGSVDAANNTITLTGIGSFSLFSAGISCSNPTNGGTIGSAQTICSGRTPAAFTQTAAPSGTVAGTLQYQWQISVTSAATGFSNISGASGSTYQPGALTQTSWYKRLVKVDCESSWLESNVVQITVNQPSFVPSVFHVSDLQATGTNIKWYAASSGGSALASNTVITNGTTYYATQTVNGVESSSRLAVTASIDQTPCAPIGSPTQSFSAGSTVANLLASGSDIRWYASANGGTYLDTSVILTSGTYYATQTIDCTESANRLAVVVNIN